MISLHRIRNKYVLFLWKVLILTSGEGAAINPDRISGIETRIAKRQESAKSDILQAQYKRVSLNLFRLADAGK